MCVVLLFVTGLMCLHKTCCTFIPSHDMYMCKCVVLCLYCVLDYLINSTHNYVLDLTVLYISQSCIILML